MNADQRIDHLKRIKEPRERAWPGKWRLVQDGLTMQGPLGVDVVVQGNTRLPFFSDEIEEAKFIVFAANHWNALLEVIYIQDRALQQVATSCQVPGMTNDCLRREAQRAIFQANKLLATIKADGE